MEATIPDSWRAALGPVFARSAMRDLNSWLGAEEAAGKAIYPPRDQRLRAFELTPLDAVRVVILGQDPYHGPGQAHGLAFSVPKGQRIPPSLRNIYTELADDLGRPVPDHGDLTHWAQQGVLLMNSSLSVEDGKAGSHAKRGWHAVTEAALQAVADRPEPSVFMLWGKHAQGIADRIEGLDTYSHHLILRSAHPSPLSARRGFFGSKPFSRANAFLKEHRRGPVDWLIQH
ncbi:MAG: uracil-DNA glycosylase [Pontixanthobacter sp.]